MQTRLTILALTLALTIITSTQSRAEVAWSTIPSGCVLQTGGANLASSDAAHGIVTFATGASGDIKMSCPVPFSSNLYGYYNYLAIAFYNDHGFDGGVNHCIVAADFLSGNLNFEQGRDIVTVTTQNQSFSGKSVLRRLFYDSMDFQSNYYWVDIQLHRDSPRATCNPVIAGTYLQAY